MVVVEPMDRFAALLEYQYERWGGTRHPVSRTVGSCPAPGQVVPGDPGPGTAITIHHDKSGHQIWRQRERELGREPRAILPYLQWQTGWPFYAHLTKN